MNVSKLLPVAIIIVLGLVIFAVWPKDTSAPDADGPTPTPPLISTDPAATPPRSGNAAAPQPPAPSPPPPTASSQEIAAARALLARAEAMIAADKPVEARDLLHQAMAIALPEADRAAVRQRIHSLNDKLVFSKAILPGDTGCLAYIVKRGDLLQRIARAHDIDWRLLKKINGITDPRTIRPGWRIKVLKGPFHVVVHKRAFRLEVFQGERFVCQFKVGLGADNGTPAGRFVVSDKLVNPPWRNPRTGELIRADDPQNPLGEHWIGLAGAEPATADLKGYGIHGTIEPSTIGTQASMGCVRMLGANVERLYSLLMVGKSQVTIVE